ncbi:aminotransferase class V-fold PLP-dependent enzyme [Nonomuraea sp. NPDC049758]|uniref:aminotransferase class V-fold PLP-dependent enzyme n=1 Tax=Nonomuraea sp. NPDC049758 TaxID=3154360 RepID=UPI00342DA4F9
MRRHRPRLVAATHIPTNSGLVQPVAEIGRHCRELDLLYLVDACQYPVDVEEIGCDLLTATCRKFPRGSGFLYVADHVLDAGYEPLFIDMHGARWTEPGRYEPVATAARFEDWEFPYSVVLDRGRRLGALVTFAVEGWAAEPFKAALDARGVNSALSFRHFAQFDFGDKDVEWCLRLSPHYYNTEREVDLVVAAVAELAAAPR